MDGVAQPQVDAFAATTSSASSAVYSTGTLPLGTHTLTVSNAGSSSLELDAIQTVRPQPGEVGSSTVAADDAGWSTAGFTHYTSQLRSLPPTDYYHQQSWSTDSTTTDGTVHAGYTCSLCDRLQLVTGTASNLGIATVRITDETGTVLSSTLVDLYASSRQPAHVVFDSGLLSAAAGKKYTLTVLPSASKNASSSAYWLEVQSVRVTGDPVVSAVHQPPPMP